MAPLSITSGSPTAEFWDDVFVRSHLPWGRFAESAIFHAAFVAVLWSSVQLWPATPRIVQTPAFHSSDVAAIELPAYLPPLDTGGTTAPLPQKGDPEHASQPIISVPSEPDNRQQTVVTPPNLKLTHDVPLPNVVAWSQTQPSIPVSATAQPSALRIPALPNSVVAPAPEIRRDRLDSAPTLTASVIAPAPDVVVPASKREVLLPQVAVIEPPPAVSSAETRRLTDVNIGRSEVVAPAPQLPMSEQRAAPLAQSSLGNPAAAVVPPPPTVDSAGAGRSDGRLIALNVRPAPPATTVDPPNGNRRGTFAATPEGKPGASGTPPVAASTDGAASGTRGAANSTNKNFTIPRGLFVGAAPNTESSSSLAGGGNADPPRIAKADPPAGLAPRIVASELPSSAQSQEERQVFAGRKSYSMTLSMPNLNSAGGSWVMHFVELREAEKQGDLLAPVVTRTADPGYPLELMRQNVHGTVSLTAVIHSDGSVGDVRVINGIDDRLDQYACDALLRWHFLPAMKNGNPVALQAVVMIPFRPRKGF